MCRRTGLQALGIARAAVDTQDIARSGRDDFAVLEHPWDIGHVLIPVDANRAAVRVEDALERSVDDETRLTARDVRLLGFPEFGSAFERHGLDGGEALGAPHGVDRAADEALLAGGGGAGDK